MVKSYLKYDQSKSFGLVASNTSNLVWSAGNNRPGTTSAGCAIVAANEQVLTWDIKKGELLSRWRDDKCRSQVTAITQSNTDRDLFAVGYDDGSIRIWDAKIATAVLTFNGHRAAVTKLAFDKTGVRLASGARDTDVIVWDLVAEVGQYKLRGHKDQVTGLCFVEPDPPTGRDDNGPAEGDEGAGTMAMAVDDAGTSTAEGFLLTTGKDSLVKLWDLSSRHCIETHVAQTDGECWALGVSPDLSGCVTAANDGEMKVWGLNMAALASSTQQADPSQEARFLRDRGTLHRQSSKDKTTEIIFHPRKDYFAVHGAEKAVEVWRIRTEAEVKKSLLRKRKRRREKLAEKGKKSMRNGDSADPADVDEDDDETIDVPNAGISDVMVRHVTLRTTGKVRSVDWAINSVHKDLQLLVGGTNNLIELYNIASQDKVKSKDASVPDYSRTLAVELPGHRTDIRALGLSSDDRMLASAANGSLKIWNVRTQSCVRTFDCGYALCCAFLPGDKVVVVGTKEGELQLYDVASAALIESVMAHEKSAIWSLQVHPEGKSVVTGGADKTAKFWDFKIVQEPVLGSMRTTQKLKLVQSRILKVSEDILSLRFSPDAKLLAVALLDNTVKVFFANSLKLYLNLYGHKLPVLSMDISFDSKLIITSSADKTIRIWGLDFGDCHKALLGHKDSILQVAFVPHNRGGSGHHFFSGSKDRTLRYWDADKFEQIQRLDGHHGEVWALAVARDGSFVVSAAHDRSMRMWDETDEQIFLEEERERELEELYEGTLAASLEKDDDLGGGGVDDEGNEVGAATKQTTETLMAGERVAEALELGIADLNAVREWKAARQAAGPNAPGVVAAAPQRSTIFMALGGIPAEDYVLSVLQKIKPAALTDALLVLPFASVPALLTFVDAWASRGMNIPLTCRVLSFVLQTHHRQIVASRTMRGVLERVRKSLRAALRRQRDEMGYNLAALRVVGERVREGRVRGMYVDGKEGDREKERQEEEDRKVKKRAFVNVS